MATHVPNRLEKLRSSIWCNPFVAIGAFALGAIILRITDQLAAPRTPIIPVVIAIGLFFVGLTVIGLRLIIFQHTEDRHVGSLKDRVPSPDCPRCRYNLTGNTSGVCPECGLTVKPRRGERQ